MPPPVRPSSTRVVGSCRSPGNWCEHYHAAHGRPQPAVCRLPSAVFPVCRLPSAVLTDRMPLMKHFALVSAAAILVSAAAVSLPAQTATGATANVLTPAEQAAG